MKKIFLASVLLLPNLLAASAENNVNIYKQDGYVVFDETGGPESYGLPDESGEQANYCIVRLKNKTKLETEFKTKWRGSWKWSGNEILSPGDTGCWIRKCITPSNRVIKYVLEPDSDEDPYGKTIKRLMKTGLSSIRKCSRGSLWEFRHLTKHKVKIVRKR